MKIGLVGSSLIPGGAERVQALLANHWVSMHETFLITIHGTGEDFYPLHPEVRRVGLDAARVSRTLGEAVIANARRVAALHRCFKESKIDVVVSFHTRVNVLAIIAARLAGIPIIVSERVDRIADPEPRKWRIMQEVTYRLADALVVQTSSAVDAFRKSLPPEKIIAIPNPVMPPAIDGSGGVPTSREYLVAVGRLERQKGFDLLIDAFARMAGRFSVDLVIVGEGSERQSLQQQVLDLGLGDRVHFTGVIRQPATLVAKAKMLVAPSRYEGFPNVLLEAMAVGTPVVAANCRSGPADIVTEGVDGLLVPVDNVPALVEAIESLLSDDERRSAMGRAGTHVLERFSLDAIAGRWAKLIQSIVDP